MQGIWYSVSQPWLRILKQMLHWNACTKSLDRCYAQLKLIWPNQLPLIIVMSFLATQHGQFALPYHTVLKASPGAAFLGQDMLFEILFVADWHKIGEHRQTLTDCSNQRENNWHIDYDYKVGDKVLVGKEGILHKAESMYGKEPWTIITVHLNGTIRIECGTKMERLNIQRVIPFTDKKFL